MAALRKGIGVPRPLILGRYSARDLATPRSEAGEAVWAMAWSEVRVLSLDEVIADALRFADIAA